jgi:uncharacterized membrane protein
MGPTTIGGIPAHPLLVHFVVVLVPIAAILTVLSVLWPAAHRRLGLITPAIAFVTLVLVPITTHAGEWLEHRESNPGPLLREHAELGDQLLPWSIGVFAVSALWWALRDSRTVERLNGRLGSVKSFATGRFPSAVIIVATIVLAVGSLWMIYRIGDSGAHSVWHDRG